MILANGGMQLFLKKIQESCCPIALYLIVVPWNVNPVTNERSKNQEIKERYLGGAAAALSRMDRSIKRKRERGRSRTGFVLACV